jgi:hypothetical protein
MKFQNVCYIIFFLSIFFSCEDDEQYPVVPQISYEEFYIRDSIDPLGNEVLKATLVFELKDGDNNVGLRDSDTTGKFARDSVYYHNLFITLFEKKDGVFQIVELKAPHHYRTPYIETNEEAPEPLKAEVKVDMEYTKRLFTYDTFTYEFYIVDRDLNKSNTESTPEFIYRDDPQ